MILEANHITFSYTKNGRKILDDFSLKVGNHERVGLSAPSGFGKTTLCQLLAGYLKPNQGTITLNGQPLPKRGPCPVQMIWQYPERVINPRLHMREVLTDGEKIEPRIIKGLGIEEDWMNRYPSELSGGEMQRFCIARALVPTTRFIIADEISTMLDLITQSQIWNFLLEEVKRREIGLVAITHSDELMNLVTTRVVDLEQQK